MAENKDRDYLIDGAKTHRYRNQSELYQKKYHEWRTNPKNPFGYTFVHDSRIRTYVDGEGYLEETPVANEKKALGSCYRLAGVTLLIMVAVSYVRYIVMDILFEIPNGGRMFHSEINGGIRPLADPAAYVLLTLNLFEFLLPLFFLKAATRMPSRIAVPLRRSRNISVPAAVIMMLVITTIGRLFNSAAAFGLEKLRIDIPYFDQIRAEGTVATVVCSIGQHVLLSILLEIIFRGYLLQMFRQFGDSFAVIVTSIMGCLTLYDLSQVGYMFCAGAFAGIITVRSGSIKSACIMRIIARFYNYILTFAVNVAGDYWGTVIEYTVCVAVLLSSAFVYIRLSSRRRWSFEVSSAGTYLTMSEKIRELMSSLWLWIWFFSAVTMSMLLVRFL